MPEIGTDILIYNKFTDRKCSLVTKIVVLQACIDNFCHFCCLEIINFIAKWPGTVFAIYQTSSGTMHATTQYLN